MNFQYILLIIFVNIILINANDDHDIDNENQIGKISVGLPLLQLQPNIFRAGIDSLPTYTNQQSPFQTNGKRLEDFFKEWKAIQKTNEDDDLYKMLPNHISSNGVEPIRPIIGNFDMRHKRSLTWSAPTGNNQLLDESSRSVNNNQESQSPFGYTTWSAINQYPSYGNRVITDQLRARRHVRIPIPYYPL